jgi:hypothetical protein
VFLTNSPSHVTAEDKLPRRLTFARVRLRRVDLCTLRHRSKRPSTTPLPTSEKPLSDQRKLSLPSSAILSLPPPTSQCVRKELFLTRRLKRVCEHEPREKHHEAISIRARSEKKEKSTKNLELFRLTLPLAPSWLLIKSFNCLTQKSETSEEFENLGRWLRRQQQKT